MKVISTVPAPAYFAVSAIFHYLGPSLAVLLFATIDVLGVAWLRIVSAALVFALWRRPWRLIMSRTPAQRRVLLALGVVLAAMNVVFYLAIARLPLSTVGAIEFLGIIVLAAAGVRTRRNVHSLLRPVSRRSPAAEFGGGSSGIAFDCDQREQLANGRASRARRCLD